MSRDPYLDDPYSEASNQALCDDVRRLSGELANAREVLLEMDKIVAGHVDEAERLNELLRGVGSNRYWEGRWRDELALNERLLEALSGSNSLFTAILLEVRPADEIERQISENRALLGDQS